MYRIQKWGNSLGIRIPASIAKQLEVKEGSAIDLYVTGGQMIVKKKTYTLEELLKDITDDQIHDEVDWGGKKGDEEW